MPEEKKLFRPSWFHLQDGLYFARAEDGDIIIKKNADGASGSVKQFEMKVTESEFMSLGEHLFRRREDPAIEHAKDATPDITPEDNAHEGEPNDPGSQ